MTGLPATFHQKKSAEIQSRLAKLNLDGMLLLDASNVRYASGFVHIPSERPLGLYLPSTGDPVLFVPLLEQEHASETWIRDIRTYFEYPGDEDAIVWMARESGARRLGIDSIAYEKHAVVAAEGIEIIVSPLVEQMRWIKSADELELIEQAAHYADFCLENVLENAASIIRDGGTELDVLSQCLGATAQKMQAELSDTFELRSGSVVGTVHSGPRAALPHGRPGKRQPLRGETLIAGIGATVGGYHAESGVTFILGEPTTDQWHCLRAMEACNRAAIEALRPGQLCWRVNEAALAELRNSGLGETIRHRIGHGMGLQGHESPWLAPGDNTILEPGMVFSNEPGIYRPNVDGYRTINSMIVTDSSARVPSRFLSEHPLEKRVITW